MIAVAYTEFGRLRKPILILGIVPSPLLGA